MRRDRTFLASTPFTRSDYASIVQTTYPGAHDGDYRSRVKALVAQAEASWPACPRFSYTEQEHGNWSLVSQILILLQDRYSCLPFLHGRELLQLSLDTIPQLDDVSARMESITGFMLAPVGGLLDKGEFLSMLAQKVMRCTPYIRHPSYPFFTPEPDIIHELRGHAPMFLHPEFVEMSLRIGRAAGRAVETGDQKMLDLIGLFYWYTVEYGLVKEGGEVKIFGAGNNGGIQDLLRSIDPTIEHRPFSLEAVRHLSIDYDAPQDLFFVAESFEQVLDYADQLVTAAYA